jgi:hypothetical protein
MTDSSDFGIGRKRKANFALRDEEEDDTNKQHRAPESYMASEEELKKRRILKVVRSGGATESDNAPKGRFTFMNPTTMTVNQTASQEKEKKPVDGNINNSINDNTVLSSNRKITVTTSTIKLNKPLTSIEKVEEKPASLPDNKDIKVNESNSNENKLVKNSDKLEDSSKIDDISASTEKVKSELTEENKEKLAEIGTDNKKEATYQIENSDKKFKFTGISESSAINPLVEDTKPFSKPFPFQNSSASSGFSSGNLLNTNPFLKRDNAIPSTISTNNPFTDPTTSININRNPFTNNTSSTNPFAQSNISLSSSISTSKPFFNFNLTSATTNPNWNSDDEDNENDLNPEEEIKISGTPSKKEAKPVELFNPNLHKLVKLQLDDLLDYNFTDKKYQSKGKGDISLELIRTDNNKVIAMCVYRNNALKILFKANLISKITTITTSNKNFKHIIVIQKLFANNESTTKPEAKIVRLVFQSENDFILFKDKFERAIQILDSNDLTVFPPKVNESQKAENESKDKE